tara:strand:- start:468 stop:1280 length:813 start_codon:yes stop_codon:yes gene_type:complete
MNDDLVTIDVIDGVADVRLNRPEKYNALNPEMFSAINQAGEKLSEAKEVRAVVLSGNGNGFCAGLDMSSFSRMADSPNASEKPESLEERRIDPANFAQNTAYIWKKLPMPVITSIHGVAYGGGAQIALGGDIRIAAPAVKMSILEIKWGLIPDMSLSQTLRDLVSLDVAKELMFTGRVLNGEQAKNLGLVTHVDQNPLERALALAKEIASKSPDAVRAGKKLLEESWNAEERFGLELEDRLQRQLIGSPNQVEAITANFENREPNFTDPE